MDDSLPALISQQLGYSLAWFTGKKYRKPPYSMVKTRKKPWFPVKMFLKKPIQWGIDQQPSAAGTPPWWPRRMGVWLQNEPWFGNSCILTMETWFLNSCPILQWFYAYFSEDLNLNYFCWMPKMCKSCLCLRSSRGVSQQYLQSRRADGRVERHKVPARQISPTWAQRGWMMDGNGKLIAVWLANNIL